MNPIFRLFSRVKKPRGNMEIIDCTSSDCIMNKIASCYTTYYLKTKDCEGFFKDATDNRIIFAANRSLAAEKLSELIGTNDKVPSGRYVILKFSDGSKHLAFLQEK